MSDLEHKFLQIITKGKKDNTYKFALARFLLDYSRKLDIIDIKKKVKLDQKEIIKYHEISKAFLRYYWHQECKYKIKQNHNPAKLPLVVKIIRKVFGRKYISDSFKDMEPEKIDLAIKLIQEHVFGSIRSKKSQVIPRFQKISGVTALHKNTFYDYDETSIKIFPKALLFFHENYTLLFKLVILEWTRFLEKVNTVPRLVSKLESEEIKRSSLSKFVKILGTKTCFYCENSLEENKIHVDHFIPWSYIFEDEPWNLVVSCDKCNLKKHDSLVDGYLNKLIDRNAKFQNKILSLKKSLIELDSGKGWKKEIRRQYRNCEEQGFSVVRLS